MNAMEQQIEPGVRHLGTMNGFQKTLVGQFFDSAPFSFAGQTQFIVDIQFASTVNTGKDPFVTFF